MGDNRKAQARLFDLWVLPKAAVQPREDGYLLLLRIVTVNSGAHVIHGCDVVPRLGDDELGVFSLGTIPPNDRTDPRARLIPVAVIDSYVPTEHPHMKKELLLSTSFTDSSGNRRLRTYAGELRLLYNLGEVTDNRDQHQSWSESGWSRLRRRPSGTPRHSK